MNILELLREPNSRYFLIPLATAILGVLAKVISQNDKIGIKRPIDLFYLAPNLLVANFILILSEYSKFNMIVSERQMDFSDACMSALLLNVGATFIITFWIRKLGWNPVSEQLRAWNGIIIPDLMSVAMMYFVFKIIAV